MAKFGNKVAVSGGSFNHMVFQGSTPKNVYTADKGAPRVQDKRDGVPLWNVTVAAQDSDGQGGTFTVGIPMATDPGQLFEFHQPVRLLGHVAGSGKVGLWHGADAIEAVKAAPVAASA